MRIIIDARSFNQGGYGSLLLGILENLDYNANEYAVIGNKDFLEPLKLPCKIIDNKSKPHSILGYSNHNLAKVINDYDCYFTPNYIIPLGIKINTYLVIHDMLFVDRKKHNHRRLTDFLKRTTLKRTYNKATGIFAVSEFSKSRVIDYFGGHKEITVINTGLSNAFKNAIDKLEDKKENYIVYSGTLKQHKNINAIIEALSEMKWKYKLHILLQSQNISRIDKIVKKKYAKNPNIIIKTNLSVEDYAREIKWARAYVRPSYYEGNASPILEPLYAHTDVVISKIPVHQEVFNKTQVNFFSPDNIDELINILNEETNTKIISDEVFNNRDNKQVTQTILSKFKTQKSKDYVRRNFIFNVIYQVLVVITPLITAPYVARVLGVANIGKFSFAFTLATYFVIFGYLGFQQYAQRAIAEVQKDREKQTEVFWQIVIVRLIPVAIALAVLFILYTLNVFGAYSPLILYFSVIVAGTAFDINFYFHGKENFFLVMIMNLLIRVGFIISIFSFIKTRYDLNTYVLLYSLMVVGGYVSMWLALPINLRKIKLKTLNLKKHLRGSLALFLPVAAISIYAILDKTLIGLLVHGQAYQKIGYITVIANISDLENGYYYQAERIIKAILSIILAFGIVMTTRNSIEYSSNRLGTVKRNTYKAFRFVFALGVPLAVGAIVSAQAFVPLFFGQGYEKVSSLMMIYAPVILMVGCSNVIGVQYLLPTKRDKLFSIAVLIGFVINLGCNIILIPFLSSVGAIIGTLISEFSIAFIEYMFIRKEISLNIIFKIIYKYLIAGAIMGIVTYAFYYFVLVKLALAGPISNLIFIVLVGVLSYYACLLILRDKYIFTYTKTVLIKIKHAFQYLSRDVLFRSNTATALLNVSSLSGEVKNKSEVPVIAKDKKEKKNEQGK